MRHGSIFSTVRLNAYLARAGVASRRGADELIKAGRVLVNGAAIEANRRKAIFRLDDDE